MPTPSAEALHRWPPFPSKLAALAAGLQANNTTAWAEFLRRLGHSDTAAWPDASATFDDADPARTL